MLVDYYNIFDNKKQYPKLVFSYLPGFLWYIYVVVTMVATIVDVIKPQCSHDGSHNSKL